MLSDGQYNYIHRKKGKNEEYHNLTDNIKTLSSDNTELLSVTNYNKTTNTATLHPKHDAQKEQVLESTRNTITINHGTNGTAEKTTVDTNPQKVLEHENLISNSQYVTIEHEEESNTSEIKTDKLDSKLIELNNKIPTSVGVRNLLSKSNQGKTNWRWGLPDDGVNIENYDVRGVNAVKLSRTIDTSVEWGYIEYKGLLVNLIEENTKYTLSFDVKPSVDVTFSASLQRGDSGAPLTDVARMNKATANRWNKVSCVLTSVATLPEKTGQVVYLSGMPVAKDNYLVIKNIKLEKAFIPSDWSPAPEDTQEQFNSLNSSLAQKQDKLTAGTGITIQGNTISATGGDATSTVQYFTDSYYRAYEHRVETSDGPLLTFSFECYNTAETVINGELKQTLALYLRERKSISNGALTITYDGTTMKLLNSASSENVNQHATFTFYGNTIN